MDEVIYLGQPLPLSLLLHRPRVAFPALSLIVANANTRFLELTIVLQSTAGIRRRLSTHSSWLSDAAGCQRGLISFMNIRRDPVFGTPLNNHGIGGSVAYGCHFIDRCAVGDGQQDETVLHVVWVVIRSGGDCRGCGRGRDLRHSMLEKELPI